MYRVVFTDRVARDDDKYESSSDDDHRHKEHDHDATDAPFASPNPLSALVEFLSRKLLGPRGEGEGEGEEEDKDREDSCDDDDDDDEKYSTEGEVDEETEEEKDRNVPTAIPAATSAVPLPSSVDSSSLPSSSLPSSPPSLSPPPPLPPSLRPPSSLVIGRGRSAAIVVRDIADFFLSRGPRDIDRQLIVVVTHANLQLPPATLVDCAVVTTDLESSAEVLAHLSTTHDLVRNRVVVVWDYCGDAPPPYDLLRVWMEGGGKEGENKGEKEEEKEEENKGEKEEGENEVVEQDQQVKKRVERREAREIDECVTNTNPSFSPSPPPSLKLIVLMPAPSFADPAFIAAMSNASDIYVVEFLDAWKGEVTKRVMYHNYVDPQQYSFQDFSFVVDSWVKDMGCAVIARKSACTFQTIRWKVVCDTESSASGEYRFLYTPKTWVWRKLESAFSRGGEGDCMSTLPVRTWAAAFQAFVVSVSCVCNKFIAVCMLVWKEAFRGRRSKQE